MVRLLVIVVFVKFFAISAHSHENAATHEHKTPAPHRHTSEAVLREIPEGFLNLLQEYIELRYDHSHIGAEPSVLEARKIKFDAVLLKMRTQYPNNYAKYLTFIVANTKNQTLKNTAYFLPQRMNFSSNEMLDFSRDQLISREWEEGLHMSHDISNQLRIIQKYGDESDLVLWESIWARMDERERETFGNFKKMLTKSLKGKKPQQRASDSSQITQKNSPTADKESIFSNKWFVLGGGIFVMIGLFTVFKGKANI